MLQRGLLCSHAALLVVVLFIPGRLLAAEAPLHQKIDSLMESAAVGPLAEVCSDADFVRRVWLDLAGVIPSANEVRTFLADKDSGKRAKLIDRLLASPQFSRHMALVFDAMFMERRPDKAVKTTEYQEYLYQSFSSGKPLDQLYREILTSDGVDDAMRPASRFLLDRDCEPNVVTRDVGRVMFGMDLQCAQCHDHPLVDDYAQADYYGLYAFLFRTSSFSEAKGKKAFVAEKGEGEANYKSVFTGDSADRVPPRVPRGSLLVEPEFAKGDEYVVKPAKDTRHVPKFSRREALAKLIADSTAFRRNLANRIWAHVMGRGLVHPVDNHHPGNPPSHSEVLTLVSNQLAAMKFDLRGMLRELMLTKAYQRSCETLAPTKTDFAKLTTQVGQWEKEKALAMQKEDSLDEALDAAKAKLKTMQEELKKGMAALKPQQEALAAAQQSLVKLKTEIDAAKAAHQKKKDQHSAVEEAAAKTKLAIEKVAGDKVLIAAAEQIATRAKALLAEVDVAAKKVADVDAKRPDLEKAVATAQQTLDKAKAGFVTQEKIVEQETAIQTLWWQKTEEAYRIADLESRMKLAESVAKYQETEKSNKADAERMWNQIVDDLAIRNQLGSLRPLTAEQFTFSLLQATGQLDATTAGAIAAIEKSPPEEMKKATAADKPRLMAKLAEPKVFDAVRGNVTTFVGLFGGLPGQEFQATVNQALFLENGSQMESWLRANAGNLIDRLQKLTDVNALADEMYVSVMNRPATDVEREAVNVFLKDRKEDRLLAIQEMVWGLLTSNEFRFIH